MDKRGAVDRISARRWFPAVIWFLRIAVGSLFVMSGFVKGVDLWGFVFKIEEYMAVWGIPQPRSVAVTAGIFLCGYELVFGFLLATGCYKRFAVWALSAMMAFMLPLTLYIAVADPVSDCGCFGDFWVVSNTFTFLKNLVISAALAVLLVFNHKLRSGIFEPAIQWIVGAWVSLYIIIVALYGYNVQPMLDFRPYPVGSPLIPVEQTDDEEDDHAEEMTFIYERDGERRGFKIDSLPDSTWTFVERTEPADVGGADASSAQLAIYDRDGEDVTREAVSTDGEELLLVIPELQRVDISYTYFLNELKQWADTSGVEMVCLIGADADGIDFWKDVSMASYEVYSAEDTKLKEISRGTMSLVELEDGLVKAKYTLSSIDGDILDKGPQGPGLTRRMAPRPQWWLRTITGVLVACLLILYMFQNLILAINSRIKTFYQKKGVNLQAENKDACENASDDLNHNKLQNNHEKEHRSR